MRYIKPALLLLICITTIKGASQDCKYPKKMIKHAQKRLESEKIVSATNFEVTFKDFNKVGSTHFVKSEKAYYLGLTLVRDFSRKVEVMVDNPLVFILKNDSIVTLYPDKSIADRGNMSITSPMGTKFLKSYYEVSPEQLQLFIAVPIKEVKLYVTLKKKSKEGESSIEIFEFEIKKEKWRTNFMTNASCILQ